MNFKEQINELKETIENLQKKVKDLEKSCEKSYELPECNDDYYCIEECYNGKFISSQYCSNLIPKEQNDNYLMTAFLMFTPPWSQPNAIFIFSHFPFSFSVLFPPVAF